MQQLESYIKKDFPPNPYFAEKYYEIKDPRDAQKELHEKKFDESMDLYDKIEKLRAMLD